MPRDTKVRIDLGDRAARVRTVELVWEQEDVAARSTVLHYRDGAPKIVEHRADLPAGTWRLEVFATERDGAVEERTSDLEVPLEGDLFVRF